MLQVSQFFVFFFLKRTFYTDIAETLNRQDDDDGTAEKCNIRCSAEMLPPLQEERKSHSEGRIHWSMEEQASGERQGSWAKWTRRVKWWMKWDRVTPVGCDRSASDVSDDILCHSKKAECRNSLRFRSTLQLIWKNLNAVKLPNHTQWFMELKHHTTRMQSDKLMFFLFTFYQQEKKKNNFKCFLLWYNKYTSPTHSDEISDSCVTQWPVESVSQSTSHTFTISRFHFGLL